MSVITRFAPSPTGFLHIGGARTALFNWLFARHHGGEFHLRIEDTDRARSTQPAIDAILDGMNWLGLKPDGEIIYQFSRAARHAEIAHEMLARGKAYRCYTTAEELTQFRAEHPHAKFRSPYRDDTTVRDLPFVIRLKAPLDGDMTINDRVQGPVTVANSENDDMVLLRSDGTPTYMLAVVVDDHDMGITHVIRGDDHLTNAFRQALIYEAMSWEKPTYAHIPLIHGADGAKLSKRHGALGVDAYREMGYLPEAVCNYLLRLGWGHGDDEIISREQAIEWFDLDGVGKAPSRFDFAKLENLNGHYIREADDERLVDLVVASDKWQVTSEQKTLLIRAMGGLKQRAKNIKELAENAAFYIARPTLSDEIKTQLAPGLPIISGLLPQLEALLDWNHDSLQALCKAYGEANGLKLGAVMGPLRLAITGKPASPSMFEAMEILGKNETLGRLKDIC